MTTIAQTLKEAEEGEDLIAIHYRKADNRASMQMKRNAIMIGNVPNLAVVMCVLVSQSETWKGQMATTLMVRL